MAKIRKIEIDKEVYCSLSDILAVLRASKSTDEVIELLEPKKEREPLKDLSEFNKNISKGLNWNPKEHT